MFIPMKPQAPARPILNDPRSTGAGQRLRLPTSPPYRFTKSS